MYFTIDADVVDIALSATGIVTVTLDTPLMILLLSPVRSVLEAEKLKAENMGAALAGSTRIVPDTVLLPMLVLPLYVVQDRE